MRVALNGLSLSEATLDQRRSVLSEAIHAAIMSALEYPRPRRSSSARRALIAELFSRVEAQAGISPRSPEITITETPKANWGIRGQNAADLTLNYRVDV
ncbi:MAG: tautomerase family protein [Streptosporangiaceae bacterium]